MADVRYEVVGEHLVRHVVPRRGEPYTQRCSRATFIAVAQAIDEHRGDGVTSDLLHRELDLPHTQVVIALEFMKERGCVEVRFRRSFPASGDTYLDAMIEYFSLLECPSELG